MKLGLTEKQYEDIISKILEQSEAEPVSPEPEAGTSSTQTGGKGYPEVGKWESGVTRGPGNQVGITKWSDVVGSKLTRSKGNQLKEQVINPVSNFLIDRMSKYTTIKTPLGSKLQIPIGSKILGVYEGNTSFFNSVKNWISKDKGGLGNSNTDRWLPQDAKTVSGWLSVFPRIIGSVSSFKTPDGKVYTSTILNTKLNSVNNWEEFYSLEPDLKSWSMNYVDSQGLPYQMDKIDSFLFSTTNWLEKNGEELIWIAAAIVAGILSGGIADLVVGGTFMSGAAAGTTAISGLGVNVSVRALVTYLAEAGVWGTKGVINVKEGKTISALTDFTFGFLLPICHGTYFSKLGLGNVTELEVKSLSSKIIGKSDQELVMFFEKGATKREIEVFKKVTTIPKETWEKVTIDVFKDASGKLTKMGKNPKTVLNTILLKSGDFVTKKWYRRLPAVLTHDLVLLHTIQNIATKFGVEDKLSTDEFLPAMVNGYNESPNKTQYIKDVQNKVNKSKTYDELKNNFSQGFKKNLPKIMNTKKMKPREELIKNLDNSDYWKEQ
jgi:hypothetical protein